MEKKLLCSSQDESINILLNLSKQSGFKSRITARIWGAGTASPGPFFGRVNFLEVATIYFNFVGQWTTDLSAGEQNQGHEISERRLQNHPSRWLSLQKTGHMIPRYRVDT